MTLPPTPRDDAKPVVLQEPERELAPAWRDTGTEGFVLRPEESGVPGLHPDWAQVLAAGETPLWQGAPDPRAAGNLAGLPLPLILFGGIGLIMVLNLRPSAGLVPFLMIAAFLFIRQRMKRAGGGASADRRYLLTNRAAYLARQQGSNLYDIRAFPITPTMQLGFGPRSVTFTSRRNARGAEEAEGFLGILNAADVHAMMKAVQKGQQ